MPAKRRLRQLFDCFTTLTKLPARAAGLPAFIAALTLTRDRHHRGRSVLAKTFTECSRRVAAAPAPCRQRQRGSFKYFLLSSRRNCSARTISSCDATTGARRDSLACTPRVAAGFTPFTPAPRARGSCRGSSTGIVRRAPAAPSPFAMATSDGAVDAAVEATVSLVFSVILPGEKRCRRLPRGPRRHRIRRNRAAERGILVCSVPIQCHPALRPFAERRL